MALDLVIGRLRLPTILEPVKEGLGGGLDADGLGVTAGKRRAKPYGFNVRVSPYRTAQDPAIAGEQMRRQVRALLDNDRARSGGHYLTFAADPALNGWVMIGTGSLDYAQGGRTLSDYELTFDEFYRLGNARTHREGRRISAVDRRLTTTFVDYLGLVTGGGYAAFPALLLAALPPASDYVLRRTPLTDTPPNGTYPTLAKRAGLDTNLGRQAAYCVNGDVILYERSEAQQRLGDVVIFDRQGNTAPANASMVNDLDPQTAYGWEEIYGADQQLTAGDAPVIANGLCRVRYLTVSGAPVLAVDDYIAGTGYVECGRVVALGDTAGTVFASAPASLVGVTVKEWTQERGVLGLVLGYAAGDVRLEVFVTLQRGWTGPRVEVYGRSTTGNPAVALRFAPNDAGESQAITAGPPGAALSSVNDTWDSVAVDPTANNWIALVSAVSATLRPAYVAWVKTPAGVRGRTDSLAYGAARSGVEIYASGAAGAVGWVAFTLGTGEQRAAVSEAETIMNAGGTRTAVADAAATGAGNNAVNETQATAVGDTLVSTAAPFLVAAGTYGVWARVRVVTAGTGSIYAALNGPASANTPTVTFTSLTFVWVYLGQTTVQDTATGFFARAFGAVNTRIDRVVLTSLNARYAANTWDGAADHGQAALWDVRSEPALTPRHT